MLGPTWSGISWSAATSSTFNLLYRTMSARCRSAGQTGTHCWHWVHACTKPITSAETMCSSSTAWFSCAIVTCLASGSGHASRQSLHPMHAMISRSTSLRSASKKSTCAISLPPTISRPPRSGA